MPIPAKLELTIKIQVLPTEVTTDKNSWKHFVVDCGGRSVTLSMRPRTFAKLTEAAAKWPSWVAAIAGQMGPSNEGGFVLLEPNVQVFERKPKPVSENSMAPEAPAGPPNPPSAGGTTPAVAGSAPAEPPSGALCRCSNR